MAATHNINLVLIMVPQLDEATLAGKQECQPVEVSQNSGPTFEKNG